MPTSKPRYMITDTGRTAEMLDRAQRAWPDVSDRKELLLRLAALGDDAIAAQAAAQLERERRDAQRAALERAAAHVDLDLLLGDGAWS